MQQCPCVIYQYIVEYKNMFDIRIFSICVCSHTCAVIYYDLVSEMWKYRQHFCSVHETYTSIKFNNISHTQWLSSTPSEPEIGMHPFSAV